MINVTSNVRVSARLLITLRRSLNWILLRILLRVLRMRLGALGERPDLIVEKGSHLLTVLVHSLKNSFHFLDAILKY
jgi:hypothetical protein